MPRPLVLGGYRNRRRHVFFGLEEVADDIEVVVHIGL